jgi:hypothetical protein
MSKSLSGVPVINSFVLSYLKARAIGFATQRAALKSLNHGHLNKCQTDRQGEISSGPEMNSWYTEPVPRGDKWS